MAYKRFEQLNADEKQEVVKVYAGLRKAQARAESAGEDFNMLAAFDKNQGWLSFDKDFQFELLLDLANMAREGAIQV